MSWTRVQHFSQTAQYAGTSVLNTAATLGSAVAIGDLILVGTQSATAVALTGSTLGDQLGNTYTRLTSAQGGSLWSATNHQAADLWWCIVTVAGTPTITYTPNPPAGTESFQSIIGDHFTGSDASSTRRASAGQEQGGVGAPGTGTDAITSPSVGASSGDLLYGVTTEVAIGSSTLAGGTGFTASPLTAAQVTEWRTAATAAAATFTDATNGFSDDTLTIAMAVTSAGAGGDGGATSLSEDGYLPSAAPALGPVIMTY